MLYPQYSFVTVFLNLEMVYRMVEGVLKDDAVDAPEDVKAFHSKAGTVKMIPLSLIRTSDVALRGVDVETEAFQLLVQSIKQRGVLNSILVREQNEGGVVTYGLVDGLQRFTASGLAAHTEIPARIVGMDDAELLEAQIITNMNRIQTKPAELSKHLVRLLARNPFMTRAQLAERICQSLPWIDERLSLNNLKPEIAKLVDENRIQLGNAYALSKLPQEEQGANVDAAMTESPKTFVQRMKARVKEIKEAKKSGKDSAPAGFIAVHYMQKLGDVKKEFEDDAIGSTLRAKYGLTSEDAVKAWKLAMAWMLHFDEESRAEQKRNYDAKKQKQEEEKVRLKAEREAKKGQEAAASAASIDQGW